MSDQITIRDVYDAQQRTDGKVDAVSVQVAAFTGEVKARLDSGQGKLDDHERRLRAVETGKADLAVTETRLRVLERWRWKLAGAATAVAALSGVATAAAEYVINHH